MQGGIDSLAPGAKATLAFPTEAERTAFSKTNEYKRLLALLDRVPAPPQFTPWP
jgi:hypothetical protein